MRSGTLLRARRERSGSGREDEAGDGKEMVHIVRRGSTCVAVALTSPFVSAGEIVWQIDAADPQISGFGVPGSGLALVRRCQSRLK